MKFLLVYRVGEEWHAQPLDQRRRVTCDEGFVVATKGVRAVVGGLITDSGAEVVDGYLLRTVDGVEVRGE